MNHLNNKRLYLKLGGTCNLHCKHCHCVPSTYPLSEDIFPHILAEDYKHITFGGGEPLLYMDTIRKVVERMPSGMEYKIVTNGTLLTSDLADYFNEHNFVIIFSYDGENDSRDRTYMQAWQELAKMNKLGIATLFSEDNSKDMDKLHSDILYVWQHYLGRAFGGSVWVNFVHQTCNNVDKEIGRDLAKEYCRFLAGQLEDDFRRFKFNGQKKYLHVMEWSWHKWVKKYTGRGIKCFNEKYHVMTANGKFLLCPYDTETVGDIYTGIDWDKIEAHIQKRCKSCELWESCGNTCIANTTDNECFISKVMHKHFYRLMNKYGLTYREIDEASRYS